MYPYIDEVIMRAHNAGMKVGLITNGVMIKAIASVADLLSYIQVSIPAVRAEIYKHITGGSEEALRMVLDVPSKLRGERSSGKSHTIISSKVILTDENASHAVDILRQTGDSGFDNCYFRFVGDYENRGLCLSQQSHDILRKRFQENLDLCNDKRFTNLAQLLEPASPVGRTQHKRCWCLDLRIGANVDSSGEVYLCVRDIGKQQFSIGNVSMEAFPEIWNSDRHCSVIEMLQHRYASGRCNNCRYLLYNPVIEKIIELLPFKDGTPLSQSDVRIL